MTRKVCVIGWPIAHSRSPLIHNYWIEKNHIPDALYEVKAIKGPAALRKFLGNFHNEGYVGANVTIPHKRNAYLYIKKHGELHGEAAAFGAVNTIWFNDSGTICGTNTDGIGFLKHLEHSTGWTPSPGDKVTVLGAGGVARAVLAVLWQKGCRISLVNRTFDNADRLSKQIRKLSSPTEASIEVFNWSQKDTLTENCKLLVNTTSLGMKGHGPLNIDLRSMQKSAIVYDLVYVPFETPLLAQARKQKLTAVDGLGMLVHQAIPGFRLWFRDFIGVVPDSQFDNAVLHKKLLKDLGEI